MNENLERIAQRVPDLLNRAMHLEQMNPTAGEHPVGGIAGLRRVYVVRSGGGLRAKSYHGQRGCRRLPADPGRVKKISPETAHHRRIPACEMEGCCPLLLRMSVASAHSGLLGLLRPAGGVAS